MDLKHLLNRIERKRELKIEQDIIVNIPEFQTGTEEASLESLVLILNKHQPIKKYSFDVKKLQNWCEVNNLIYYIDERNRIVNLKLKS